MITNDLMMPDFYNGFIAFFKGNKMCPKLLMRLCELNQKATTFNYIFALNDPIMIIKILDKYYNETSSKSYLSDKKQRETIIDRCINYGYDDLMIYIITNYDDKPYESISRVINSYINLMRDKRMIYNVIINFVKNGFKTRNMHIKNYDNIVDFCTKYLGYMLRNVIYGLYNYDIKCDDYNNIVSFGDFAFSRLNYFDIKNNRLIYKKFMTDIYDDKVLESNENIFNAAYDTLINKLNSDVNRIIFDFL